MLEDRSLEEILAAQLFEVESIEEVNSERLLDAIHHRVDYLLDRQPELLFSYLYRLDLAEGKVRYIIDSAHISNKVEALSKLIYERQMLRYKTKLELPQQPIDGWQW